VRRRGIQKTYRAKPSNISKNWWIVDADGKTLGRLATRIAMVLMGKHKPEYTPYIDSGDFVVVTNASKIHVTGNKLEQKEYQRYTGYLGGRKLESLKSLLARKPERVIQLAVRRMLPKTVLGKRMLSKLKVYGGVEHPHVAQKPEPLGLN
jgi:large subunit ribosomal protein L13